MTKRIIPNNNITEGSSIGKFVDGSVPTDAVFTGGNVGIDVQPTEKLSVQGIIESKSGGIKFPDATVQTTAVVVPSPLSPQEIFIKDSSLNQVLNIIAGSTFTTDRTLTIITGDANRTITINGNTVLNDWFDQNVKTISSPLFKSLTVQNNLTDVFLNLRSTTNGDCSISFGNVTQGNRSEIIYNNIQQSFSLKILGTQRFHIDNTGRIKINTFDNSSQLSIQSQVTGRPVLFLHNQDAGSQEHFLSFTGVQSAVIGSSISESFASQTGTIRMIKILINNVTHWIKASTSYS